MILLLACTIVTSAPTDGGGMSYTLTAAGIVLALVVLAVTR